MKKDKEWLLRELKKIPHEFQDGYLKAKAIYVLPLINELDEPEKVAIPQYVADWISNAKIWGYSISDSMGHVTFYDDTTQYDKAMRWANKNQDIFARAWLDGYEVEKEPLYLIRFSDDQYALKDCEGGIRSILVFKSYASHFTGVEIDELGIEYWGFVTPVEETI